MVDLGVMYACLYIHFSSLRFLLDGMLSLDYKIASEALCFIVVYKPFVFLLDYD